MVFFSLYTFLFFYQWSFLILDEIFFPFYRKTKVEKAAFIVGVPRSATTFLLELLAQDRKQFTCFKFWELLLAPSIIQKYFWWKIITIDYKIGRPIYRFSLWLDKILFKQAASFHPLSFAKPEEDATLLLCCFSSIYLNFFFPDNQWIDQHLLFDKELPERKKKRIMRFYHRCIQRHNFVFNRNGEKTFLAKNPGFVPALSSLGQAFPEGKLLYMLRSPEKAIPATISLNANLYKVFCKLPEESPLAEKTRDIIIQWYEMAREALNKEWNGRNKVIPFEKITKESPITVEEIYEFLSLDYHPQIQSIVHAEFEKSKNYKSKHQYDRTAGLNEEVLAKLKTLELQ